MREFYVYSPMLTLGNLSTKTLDLYKLNTTYKYEMGIL